ncbi:hypothetical protein AB7280_19585 [Providencia rettgeri]
MRINLGFENSKIIERITVDAEAQNLSKSQIVENLIDKYFKVTPKNQVFLSPKGFRKNERLQVTFKNESLVILIKKHSEKYKISKPKIIEAILEKHFHPEVSDIVKNTKIDNEKFKSNVFSSIITFQNKNKKIKEPAYNAYTLTLTIRSRSLSLKTLNTSYLKEIKINLLFDLNLQKKENEHNLFCYIILVNKAKLISKKLIYQETDFTEKACENYNNANIKRITTKNGIDKNEHIYIFDINYVIVKIAKVTKTMENNIEKLNIVQFWKDGFLTNKIKNIDLTKIEYVSKRKNKNYHPKDNYGGILPDKINCSGYYYIKLVNKPKSVNQILKKRHIFKIDKNFILKLMPNAKNPEALQDILSIVSILPIYDYTDATRFKK